MSNDHQIESMTEKVARVERAMRASELRFRRLFESAKDGILILDVDTGRIDDVNPFLMELLGFSRSEMVGKTVGELSPFKDMESNQAMLERLQRRGHVRYEDLPLETRDGRHIAVEFVSNVYQAGDRKVIQCNIRDITQRKWSNAALRKSEQNFRSIFANAPVGIFQSTVSCLLTVNPAMAKMFGYGSPAEMFARSVDPEALFVQHEQRRQIIREVMELDTYAVHEVEFRRMDGSTFTANLRMRAVRDIAGEVDFLRGFVEDITERKRAEEALRASEAQYRLLADNLADVLWTFDLQTMRCTYVSPSVQRLRGYTAEEAIAQSREQILTPESLALVESLLGGRISAFLAGDPAATTQVHELDLLCKSGATVRTETATTLLRNRDGGLSVVGVSRDITERLRGQKALRESEARLRTFTEAAFDGIIISEGGVFVEVNLRMAQLLGYEISELVGRKVTDIVAPEDRPLIRQNQASGLERLHEARLVRKDGSVIIVEARARHCIYSDRPMRMTAVHDITERIEAKAELVKMSQALEQSPVTIVITDPAGNIEYVNPAFTRLTGYTREEALGKNPRILKSGKTAPDNYKRLWETITAGREWRGEFLNKAKGGRLFWESAVISPVLNKAGQITNYLAVKEDITQRKQLEEQLRQAHKMEAVGQLAGGVAHDFNNIIVATLMHLGLLQDNPHLTPDTKASLREVEKETVRAINLTRQLLLFSRQQAARIGPLEMNALIHDLLKMLRRLLGENIEIIPQVSSDAIWVNADTGMMEQVVMNLCINARDAMSKGGRLTIASAIVEIQAQPSRPNPDARPGRFVCLSVSDTGCGMDEQVLERIFEPFYTTKEVGKGTGLGLSIVYGIVKQHNGWVEVESAVGEGSSFRVYLPAAKLPDVSTIPSHVDEIKGGTETILVVEDDQMVRRTVALCLRRLGYAILEAGNGLEAMKVWEKHHEKIALLFTDMVMPGNMSGLDLATRLRKEKGSLKVISSSGYRTDPTVSPLLAGEETFYLPKPYTPDVLAKVVRRCLDNP